MAPRDIRDGDTLAVEYGSGAILTGPAAIRDDGMTAVRLTDGFAVIAVRDGDGTPAHGVAHIAASRGPLPAPDGEGLWLDGFGGLALAGDTDDGIAVTRLHDGYEWGEDGPIDPEAVLSLGPWTRVPAIPGAPIRLNPIVTDAQIDAAMDILARTLLGRTPDELGPADTFRIAYAALHSLAAAARADGPAAADADVTVSTGGGPALRYHVDAGGAAVRTGAAPDDADATAAAAALAAVAAAIRDDRLVAGMSGTRTDGR